MIPRALAYAALAVLFVAVCGFLIATSERRGDPMSYAVGVER